MTDQTAEPVTTSAMAGPLPDRHVVLLQPPRPTRTADDWMLETILVLLLLASSIAAMVFAMGSMFRDQLPRPIESVAFGLAAVAGLLVLLARGRAHARADRSEIETLQSLPKPTSPEDGARLAALLACENGMNFDAAVYARYCGPGMPRILSYGVTLPAIPPPALPGEVTPLTLMARRRQLPLFYAALVVFNVSMGLCVFWTSRNVLSTFVAFSMVLGFAITVLSSRQPRFLLPGLLTSDASGNGPILASRDESIVTLRTSRLPRPFGGLMVRLHRPKAADIVLMFSGPSDPKLLEFLGLWTLPPRSPRSAE